METLSLQIYHGSSDFPIGDFATSLEDLNYKIEIVIIDDDNSSYSSINPEFSSSLRLSG